LLEPWRAGPGRYRMYDNEHEERLRFIIRAKKSGFSLKEIVELISFENASEAPCDGVKAKAETKVAEIDRKIRDLRNLRRILSKQIEACSTTDTSEKCPILAALEN